MSIDIVIPIYNAAEMLRACLASLDATLAPDDAQILLIDDASPDPAVATLMAEWLAQTRLPARGLRNARNLGFIGSVNRGFAETAGDVLLLNSDTIATPGWLQGMRAALASDARIASVTPFSNNAEICSWPDLCRAQPVPTDAARIAAACRVGGAGVYPQLPTAVGFCMLIRRAARQAIGDFDAATFGRGYGEENDWCQRAIGHGWIHVLCGDAYVVHAGGGSFAALGLKPGGDNLARLLARYPDYQRQVAEFIAADPPRALRQAILAAYQSLPESA